tara:strand:+ start:1506 stop:2213 length:708 start_codon:yes stop_codon:yes gene_type:complete
MIDVNSVYQKVLTIANKEQRGYITPQEFNLLADKAQLDIFGSYFHEAKTAHIKQTKNQLGVPFDGIDMIEEKLHPFKTVDNITATIGTFQWPNNIYSIDTLVVAATGAEVTEMSKKEIAYTENNPLTAATTDRMVYVRQSQLITNEGMVTIYPTSTTDLVLHYYRVPHSPEWGYVVVNEKALFNSGSSINFELHVSEEETVVMRILELAGVVIRSPELAQAAMVDQANTIKRQND